MTIWLVGQSFMATTAIKRQNIVKLQMVASTRAVIYGSYVTYDGYR